VFRALAHATLLVIAPPAPAGWSPGTAPLSESLRARIRAGAGSPAERAVSVLPESGRRVVSVPVEAAVRRVVGIPIGRGSTHAPVPMTRAPWGDAEPVPGVVVRTSVVPSAWLRRPTAWLRPVAATHASGPDHRSSGPPPAHHPVPNPTRQRDTLPMPTSTRVRRAAVMAFGLLVSLVAVEAAARVGRR
jgi:hypothetical protein